MRCNEARELVSGYMDDALDLATMRVVSMHLKRCDGCRGAYEGMRAVGALIARVNRVDRDPALETRMFNAVMVAKETPTLLERVTSAIKLDWRTATAAGAFIIGAALYLAEGPVGLYEYAGTYAGVSSVVADQGIEEARSFWGGVIDSGKKRAESISRRILGENDTTSEGK